MENKPHGPIPPHHPSALRAPPPPISHPQHPQLVLVTSQHGTQTKFQSQSHKICTKFHSSKFTSNCLCQMYTATLSTTNPTWTDLGSNPLLWCNRLMTTCLSHVKTVNCQDYMASVIDERRSTEHWKDDSDSGKLKYIQSKICPIPVRSYMGQTLHVATGF